VQICIPKRELLMEINYQLRLYVVKRKIIEAEYILLSSGAGLTAAAGFCT
jgi:hypothetical protein